MSDKVSRQTGALPLVGGLGMAATQWLIFCYAPIEVSMGMTQKIFYLHLPLAWWGLFSFFIVFLASVAYLRTRMGNHRRRCGGNRSGFNGPCADYRLHLGQGGMVALVDMGSPPDDRADFVVRVRGLSCFARPRHAAE